MRVQTRVHVFVHMHVEVRGTAFLTFISDAAILFILLKFYVIFRRMCVQVH